MRRCHRAASRILLSLSLALALSASGARAQSLEAAREAEPDERPPATVLPTERTEPAPEARSLSSTSAVALEPSSTALRLAALEKERQTLHARRPRLWLPVLMTLAGVAAVIIASGAYAADARCIDDDGDTVTCAWNGAMKRDAALVGVGAALAGAGIIFLSVRLVQRWRHNQGVKRIDDELRLLKRVASFSPWLSPRSGYAFGASAALNF